MNATRAGLTYEEFVVRCPDSRIVEWVGGEVVEHLPPTERHQDMVDFLATLLRHFAEFFDLGRVISAPFLMLLAARGPAREPDVLFVARDHVEQRLPGGRVDGPADLAVEVISDDSVRRDRVEKFAEYERAGVREYWIVDPRPGHQAATFWALGADGRYHAVEPGSDGAYRSTVVPGFWIRVEWLWQSPLPDSLFSLAQIAGFPPEVMKALTELKERGRGGPEGRQG